MRVCLEISTFRARFAGIAYYAWFLGQTILRQHPEIVLSGFDGLGFNLTDEANLLRYLEADHAGSVKGGVYQKLRQMTVMRAAYRRYKSYAFRRGTGAFDLFHAMNFAPPEDIETAVLPLIHDISHERFPQTHPPERVAWLRSRLQNLDRFPLVNTVSNFTASEVAEFYRYPIERIRVTHPGVNPVFRAPADPEAMETISAQKLRRRGFFLTVGTLEPRKNHGVLIDAFARLPRDFRREHPLIFVGQPGWGRMHSPHIESLRKEGSMRFTGYVDETMLRAYYEMATCLLFPTFYEGFGIPVAEAMATGLPVVVSDIEIMHEVAGPIARYVSPGDPDAWAEAIVASTSARSQGETKIDLGMIERSKGFNWEKNASETVKIYHDLMDDKS